MQVRGHASRFCQSAFYRMRARGQAPRLQRLPNGHLRVSRDDLDAWWAACEQRAA
ncbi:helix-turn-helix transcriptional regulator [Streptomyces sp. NBC_01445]|uniref:helix-turn-helix transcriptional regulator n=1 Tax=Streptomyces sp. NBC_01445 TaxID=2903869 RepID=UPI003FA358F1